jgi:hypothetical protein
MKIRCALLTFLASTLLSQGAAGAAFSAAQVARLPDWAASAARAAQSVTPPAEADAWVLEQRTEFDYLGEGRVRARQLRLVLVLGERGLEERSLTLSGLGGRGSKLKRLKAWNVRPDGEVEQLERSDSVSLEDGQVRLHTVELQKAVKGSLLAFESVLETEHPMGPVESLYVMEEHPVRSFSVEARSERPGVEVRVVLRHLAPWAKPTSEIPHRAILVQDLPSRPRDEGAIPDARNVLPWLHVSFHDSAMAKDLPSSATWNALASWTAAKYKALAVGGGDPPAAAKDPAALLQVVHSRLAREMTYRQVYLSPERGWIPLAAAEVARRRYGDCKDLATLLMAQARAAGFEAYPVLARIVEGEVEEDEPPSVFAFNHVIVAIRLSGSLGLGAEVDTPEGRMLLVDATSRFVPLGQLGAAHAGRRVLVCTERGGFWVAVPDAAIVAERARFRLAGAVSTGGMFSGTLEIREENGAMGLRPTDVEGGADELRRRCLGLGLPPDARCEVKKRSDPFDLAHPYDVLFALEYPEALRSQGSGEWTVVPPGLYGAGETIQKPGRPRQYPVRFDRRDALEYELAIELPRSLVPLLKEEKGETPLRSYAWTAEVTPGPRPELRARLAEQRRPASFGFDHKEEGLAAWKKDRTLVKRLREDGLCLKEAP